MKHCFTYQLYNDVSSALNYPPPPQIRHVPSDVHETFKMFSQTFSPSLSFCCSGSGTTEEEHYRVPGGGQYSHPGCSGADQWLLAQCWGWARELEEPGCQPLQWLLQLQRWSGTLWQGNPDHMSVGLKLLVTAEMIREKR